MWDKLTENWVLKVLSLVFALILWFFVIGERRLEVGHAVPLELENVPEGMMVANEVPSMVDVRISGPRTLLMSLKPRDISISVDLKDLQPGITSFKRLEEQLNIPSGLKVTRLSPSFVDVKLEKVREKKVPIEVVFTGRPPPEYRVVNVGLSPEQAVIRGAESELRDVTEVMTEPVDLESARESFTLMVPINYRGQYTDLQEPKTAEVEVIIEPAAGKAPEEKQEKAG